MAEAQAARDSLRFTRTVVVKLGTPVVTHMDGNIALSRIAGVVEQIAALRERAVNVVVVTSGAIGTGSVRLRRQLVLSKSVGEAVKSRRKQPNMTSAKYTAQKTSAGTIDQNAAAAVGQSLLMNMYDMMFATYNLSSAQILVTEGDADDPDTLRQVRDTTAELLSMGTIPIINENDAVTGRTKPVVNVNNEVSWDNDVLAWRVAAELRADVLVLMTDMDALYIKPDPKGPPQRLPLYRAGGAITTDALVQDDLPSFLGVGAMGDRSRGTFAQRTRLSREGLEALVHAATSAIAHGVRAAIVTTGHNPNGLLRLLAGEDMGTIFVPPLPAKL